jgi:hypothetical protein
MNELLAPLKDLFGADTWLYASVWIPMLVMSVIALAIAIFYLAVCCCIYRRGGKPGIAYIVPIWNGWCLFEIVYGHGWLIFVPGLNVILSLASTPLLAKVFSRSVGFMVGLTFLPFIFMPILAFSTDSQYEGALFG